jgi:ribosomal protein S19
VPENTDVFYVLTRKTVMPEFIGTKIAIYMVNLDGAFKVVEHMKKKR